MQDTIRQWEAGELTDVQALHALASDLGEIDSELAPLEQAKKAARNAIEAIVMRLGGKAAAAGYEMQVTQGSTRVSFDTRKCEALLAKLIANGLLDAAEDLAAARVESHVSGSLRITKERKK